MPRNAPAPVLFSALFVLFAPGLARAADVPPCTFEAVRGEAGVPAGIDPAAIPAVPSCRELAATYSVKVLRATGAKVLRAPPSDDKKSDESKRDDQVEQWLADAAALGVPGVRSSVITEEDTVKQDRLQNLDLGKASSPEERYQAEVLQKCGGRCQVYLGQLFKERYVIDGTVTRDDQGNLLLSVRLFITEGEKAGQLESFEAPAPGEAPARDAPALKAALFRSPRLRPFFGPLNEPINKAYQAAYEARKQAITSAKLAFREQRSKRAVTRGTGWLVLAAGGVVTAVAGVGVYFGLDKSHDIQTGRLSTLQEVQETSANIRTINTATRIVGAIGAAGVLSGLGLVVFNLDRAKETWELQDEAEEASRKRLSLQLVPMPGGLLAQGRF